jgi:transcription initiation factor TFIIIB Brf1 subunit/transcription initiation factor TFIIB
METCNNCNSKELTYNQLILDSYCSDCGTWQEDE